MFVQLAMFLSQSAHRTSRLQSKESPLEVFVQLAMFLSQFAHPASQLQSKDSPLEKFVQLAMFLSQSAHHLIPAAQSTFRPDIDCLSSFWSRWK